MILLGLTVVAPPLAHAVADAVVSGTVVDSVTQQPLGSVTITDSTSGTTTTTPIQGTYTLLLAPGDHVLTATLDGYVPSTTPTLTLAAGQALSTQGFTLEKSASASGTVVEKGTSRGIATVVVKLFDASSQSPNAVLAATTGPDGSWAIGEVAPGSYKVQFDSSDVGYVSTWFGGTSRDAATVVTLAADGSRTIDAGLTRGGMVAAAGTVSAQGVASLSGHVTLEPGATPVADVTVSAYSPNGGLGGRVTTDASGAYSFATLWPGYYLIEAETAPYNGLVGYLGGSVSRALATYVWVADGATLTAQDIHLQTTATLKGTVTDRGRPVAQAAVSLTGMGASVSAVQSAADGTFTLTAIPPGTYRLSARTDHVAWWNAAAEVGGATEITVPTAGDLSGYTIAMPPTYTLAGTVKTAAGVAVPNTRVMVQTGGDQRVAMTDAVGAYSLSLVASTYELAVYNQTTYSYLWSPGSATPVLFAFSADTVRNVTMPAELTVTMPIVGSDGSIPPSVIIWVSTAAHGTYVGMASSAGTVTLALPAGTYQLDSEAAGYLPWSAQLTVAAAMSVPVVLQVAGRISGVVTGTPASVTAINATTGAMFTEPNVWPGPYSFADLPLGDYAVTADPYNNYGTKCGPQVWFGGTSYLTSRRLSVANGSPLSGADFVLSCPATWVQTGTILGEIALPASAPAGAATGVLVSATNSFGSLTTVPISDGTFGFSALKPGTYDVAAYQATLGLEGHGTVTIAAGQTTILTLNLTRRGKVTGQVVGPHNEPLQASVSNGETSVWSDAQGAFSLGGISYGTHTLTITAPAPYGPAFVSVTVGAGSDVSGLVVHVPLAGRVQGELPSSAGSVEVSVYDATGRVVASNSFMGSFEFDSLPSGMLRLRFSGPEIVTEWWKDASTLAAATNVSVPPGGGVTDIAPTLTVVTGTESMTTVTGRVTYAGSPLAGVTITTVAAMHGILVKTGGDGTYSLSVPRGDTYAVKAAICLGVQWLPCAGQDYQDTRQVVADSTTKTGVDFVVPLLPNAFTSAVQPVVTGRAVSGQVLTATVGAWTPTPDSMTWQWYADGLAIYQATGNTFTLTDAEAGKVVQVIATGEKAGYATTTLPSAATDPVEVPGAIHSLTPSRLLDSRIGQGFTGPATNGTVIKLPVWGKGGVPTGASAVIINLTVTQPTASGYVTAYASGGTAPWVSNANFTPGVTVANLSLVPVGAVDGAIALKVATPGSVHVIADVQGYVVGGTVSAAGAVVPVTPARVLDTRTTQHVGTGGTISLTVAGVVGVPADASAVVANITVTGTTGPGYLTAWPAGVARPTSSNVNFVTGQTVPNMAIVKVGANKSISLFNSSGPMDMVVDIQGYVTAGTPTLPGTVQPITPTRVLDTRDGYLPVPGNTGGWVDFDSPDLAKVPQGVLINLTVTEPQAPGWLSAYPDGVARPLVSNLNFTAGAVVPNLALVALSDGYGDIYNGSTGSVHVVVDVLAYVLS
jgi:protocatechuate 3,4-dioxygenase beta subunit